MIGKVICAFMASLFFGVLFNVKKDNLIFAGFGGAIGCFVFEVITMIGWGNNLSIFMAAIAFASYSEVIARIRKTTVTTFALSALIPLVPGNGMYLTMLSIVNDDLQAALDIGLDTLSSAGLLALGILFVSTFAKLIKKPIPKEA
ncbi:uncharacterized membrane protein YjjB (DUF3815 family) [Breznakia sp. PF5-3]|uniref:threonine/serine exporter family protein n=1 Tax=unclassified Breznakia TaxID=2623764 RepID=UPI002405674D|nr:MULTISPECIES: threonine/serine exporter family protein [unclassified Breznakia]MDF9824177.1 uncharacterized membrane protein YjjB (DUF3815 family) [Breznakia sp. PM6-1]MDF9834975.1 uncharacterized membrane protein YjjB (DUF3815 family) [Breznakia sp. PF5-3]MDF9837156.1 uncharacterized membrane protein YjjB (DUF3815 family) [Breznakia sp. PFB2-8]MDF9859146.1 uncharacterized membrane protein YjjB (DUF3815 family) [Breznakia sp. PH5-24]